MRRRKLNIQNNFALGFALGFATIFKFQMSFKETRFGDFI